MKTSQQEAIASLREMREACAAAMRVLVEFDGGAEAFAAELARVGVEDGFGVRADAILQRASRSRVSAIERDADGLPVRFFPPQEPRK